MIKKHRISLALLSLSAGLMLPQAVQGATAHAPRPPGGYLLALVFVALIVWRLFRRIRRVVGRQRLSKVQPWITLGIYTVVLGLFGLADHDHLGEMGWLAGGVVFGAVLGVFGLKKTHFEPTPNGLFYTPHTHIGIALSLLLVGRIGYRLFELYVLDSSTQPPRPDDFAHATPTLAIFGLLAGYYLIYESGLLRWRFRMLREKAHRADWPRV